MTTSDSDAPRPIRFGYIGAGFMAQLVHIPNFSSLPSCEFAALAEVRQDLGRKVQARYGIPRLYRDHHELLEDTTIEAVGVSGPYALQSEIACACLRAGKHVFMEKPMAVSINQAQRLLRASEETGARLMVGYMMRYDAGNVLARNTIAAWKRSGEAGSVTYVRAHDYGGDWMTGIDTTMETSVEPLPVALVEDALPSWLPAEYGTHYVAFLQQYTHNINLIRFLLGAGERARVRHVDFNSDNYTGIVILEVGGVRAVLETGRLNYYRWDGHTQVYFEHGWVHLWMPPLLQRNAVAEVEIYRNDEHRRLGDEAVYHTTMRPQPEPRWSWAYKREAQHFLDSLQTAEPFESSGEDTLTDVRLFEEIYRFWLSR